MGPAEAANKIYFLPAIRSAIAQAQAGKTGILRPPGAHLIRSFHAGRMELARRSIGSLNRQLLENHLGQSNFAVRQEVFSRFYQAMEVLFADIDREGAVLFSQSGGFAWINIVRYENGIKEGLFGSLGRNVHDIYECSRLSPICFPIANKPSGYQIAWFGLGLKAFGIEDWKRPMPEEAGKYRLYVAPLTARTFLAVATPRGRLSMRGLYEQNMHPVKLEIALERDKNASILSDLKVLSAYAKGLAQIMAQLNLLEGSQA